MFQKTEDRQLLKPYPLPVHRYTGMNINMTISTQFPKLWLLLHVFEELI